MSIDERQSRLEEFISAIPALPVPQMKPVITYPRTVGQKYGFPPLRPIQQQAIESFMLSTTKHASLLMPVGSGKTLVALKIWSDLGEPTMLVVVPRIVLITNPWLQEMAKVGIDTTRVGQYYGEEKEIRFPITITLYQTLIMHPELLQRFSFIVFDEEQVLASEQFSKLLDYTDDRPFVLGMTGTLREALRRRPIIAEKLPVVFERTIAEARQAGILAPAEIIPIYVNLNPSEYGEYARLTELFRTLMRFAQSQPNAVRRNIEMRKAFMVNEKRLILLSNAEEKQPQVIEIIKQEPKSPTLVFSSSVMNIENLRRRLINTGIPAETITAEMKDRKRRQRIIASFGKTYYVLLSVGTLSMGFNVPFSDREIIVGGGTTLTQTEQRIGRVLRLNPDNPEKVARIYVVVARGTLDEDMLSRVREAYQRLRRSAGE